MADTLQPAEVPAVTRTASTIPALYLVALVTFAVVVAPVGFVGTAAGNHQASVFDADGYSASGDGSYDVSDRSAGGVEFTWDFDQVPYNRKTWTYETTAGESQTVEFDWSFGGCHSFSQSDADAYVLADGPGGTTELHVSDSGGCSFGDAGSDTIEIHDGYTFGVRIEGYHYDSRKDMYGTFTLDPVEQYTVTIDSVTGTVATGETVSVDYTVENTGDQATTQDVEFRVDGTLESTAADVSLATGETYSDTFTHATSATDEPSVTVDVSSDHDSDSTTVTVDGVAPTADASNSPTSGDEDVAIAFDGTLSSDNDEIATYEWDWTDDGTFETTGATPSHTYPDPGTYTVALRVTDVAGHTDTDTHSVTVADVTDPTVSVDSPADGATFALHQTLTGSAADGSGTGVATVELQVENAAGDTWDGSAFTTSATWVTASGTTSWSYDTAAAGIDADGTYTVNARAIDGDGNAATTSQVAYTVDENPPTADASDSPTAGEEDAAITFDGRASTDAVEIASYDWDWTNDGSYEATGATPSHTYPDPGTYTVGLRVTDTMGHTDTDTLEVTVEDVTGPTADAGRDRTVGEYTEVTFDGSGSMDNVGIVSYEWDWSSDGTYDATGATPTQKFFSAGTYTVSLRVTDASGNTDRDVVNVTVEASGNPGGGDASTKTPTPTPSPTASPSPTQTRSPTVTPSPTPTATQTSTGTPTGAPTSTPTTALATTPTASGTALPPTSPTAPTPTSASTGTTTGGPQLTGTGTPADAGGPSTTSGANGPGFGPVAGALAILLMYLLARRER